MIQRERRTKVPLLLLCYGKLPILVTDTARFGVLGEVVVAGLTPVGQIQVRSNWTPGVVSLHWRRPVKE